MLMYVAAPALLHVEVPKREKHIVKEPNTLDGERSIQPLSTAIFLPAGHSESVAQARSPHCLGWILLLLLGRPFLLSLHQVSVYAM